MENFWVQAKCVLILPQGLSFYQLVQKPTEDSTGTRERWGLGGIIVYNLIEIVEKYNITLFFWIGGFSTFVASSVLRWFPGGVCRILNLSIVLYEAIAGEFILMRLNVYWFCLSFKLGVFHYFQRNTCHHLMQTTQCFPKLLIFLRLQQLLDFFGNLIGRSIFRIQSTWKYISLRTCALAILFFCFNWSCIYFVPLLFISMASFQFFLYLVVLQFCTCFI